MTKLTLLVFLTIGGLLPGPLAAWAQAPIAGPEPSANQTYGPEPAPGLLPFPAAGTEYRQLPQLGGTPVYPAQQSGPPTVPAQIGAPYAVPRVNGSPYTALPGAGATPLQTVPGQSSAQPDVASNAAVAWGRLGIVRQLVREGKQRQALPLVQEFIRMKPLEPEGYFWEGVVYDNLGQSRKAIEAYSKGCEQVQKIGMDSAELRMNAGNVFLKEGQIDEAIKQYRRSAAVDPGLALVQLNLGRALIEKNELEQALVCFQRCEDLHFLPPQLSYYRAKALLKAGRAPDAIAQVRTTLLQLPEGHSLSLKIKEEFADLLKKGP